MARLNSKPKAGRPSAQATKHRFDPEFEPEHTPINLHEVYSELKDGNFARPSASTIAMMKDKNEAGFVLCVCDYFLNLKQREEIESGVF